VALLRKMTGNLRHPMSLCQPVASWLCRIAAVPVVCGQGKGEILKSQFVTEFAIYNNYRAGF